MSEKQKRLFPNREALAKANNPACSLARRRLLYVLEPSRVNSSTSTGLARFIVWVFPRDLSVSRTSVLALASTSLTRFQSFDK